LRIEAFLGIGALACLSALAVAACSRTDMSDQPSLRPLQRAPFFPDGASARSPVPGTLPWAGDSADQAPASEVRKADLALLKRGRQRFEIDCSPCHGRTGEGNGMVVQRGFPAPPSFFSPRVMQAEDAHIDSVIENGYGRMFSYGYRVAPEDRIAIVAYIRALQLSRNAALADVPAEWRSRLQAENGP
jgi:mono/diheme cytochrome c family protein